MHRGEIRWYTFALPDKRSPVLILSHDAVLPSLNEAIVALATRTQERVRLAQGEERTKVMGTVMTAEPPSGGGNLAPPATAFTQPMVSTRSPSEVASTSDTSPDAATRIVSRIVPRRRGECSSSAW